jgi:hypothetical protein
LFFVTFDVMLYHIVRALRQSQSTVMGSVAPARVHITSACSQTYCMQYAPLTQVRLLALFCCCTAAAGPPANDSEQQQQQQQQQADATDTAESATGTNSSSSSTEDDSIITIDPAAFEQDEDAPAAAAAAVTNADAAGTQDTQEEQQQQQQQQQGEANATYNAAAILLEEQQEEETPSRHLMAISARQVAKRNKIVDKWPMAIFSVDAGQNGRKVAGTFLATSHEYTRMYDYGEEYIHAWANVFGKLSSSPIIRVGGASQDKMKKVSVLCYLCYITCYFSEASTCACSCSL